MGRIKSSPVKKAARQLLQNENAFNEHFENNKILLVGTMTSKPIRNQVAGYISHLKKMEKVGPRKKKEPVMVEGEESPREMRESRNF